jgi:c-di-GMP-binding flagellar brake protein YcgR
MFGTNREPLRPEVLDDDDRDNFRVAQPLEISSLLRRVAEKSELVLLAASNEASGLCTIVQVDREQGRIHLETDSSDQRMRAAVRHESITAVCFLEDVKLQFQASSLRWETGVPGSSLSCALPPELFRFQRRAFFRVRPFQSPAPTALMAPYRLGSPRGAPQFDWTSKPNTLGVLDVSMTGIGLFLPRGTTGYPEGTAVPHVLISLEPNLSIHASVHVMHVVESDGAVHGQKLGCTLNDVSRNDLRTLQKFIDRTQMRRRQMDE